MDTVVLFIKWFFKSISAPLSCFSKAILGKGFLENQDTPLRRATLLHEIVNENAGSRSPKRSPTVIVTANESTTRSQSNAGHENSEATPAESAPS
jgi:hypothetical protein